MDLVEFFFSHLLSWEDMAPGPLVLIVELGLGGTLDLVEFRHEVG